MLSVRRWLMQTTGDKHVVLTDELIRDIKRSTAHLEFWRRYLQHLSSSAPNLFSIHLAVLVEPYLQFILDGSKTIESRFSKRRVAPYGVVRSGDIILLKRASAKGLRGLCVVSKVWYYNLTPDSWADIRDGFAKAMCADDPQFWDARRSSRFATLMRLSEVAVLPAFNVHKRDRRGWVVLRAQTQKTMGLGPGQLL